MSPFASPTLSPSDPQAGPVAQGEDIPGLLSPEVIVDIPLKHGEQGLMRAGGVFLGGFRSGLCIGPASEGSVGWPPQPCPYPPHPEGIHRRP
jgi:hypothetical protein